MPTQAEEEQVAAILDRLNNFDDPTPLEGEELKQFQRRCLVEAKRLMGLLATPRLRKTVRNDIENLSLIWYVLSQKQIIERGDCRILHSLLGRKLKQFNERKVGPDFPYPQDV